MRNRPDTGLALTDVCCVVELTKDGLEGEEDDDDDADDGVVGVDLVRIMISARFFGLGSYILSRSGVTNLPFRFESDVNAQPKPRNSQDVSETLRHSMDPNQSRKGEKSN